MCGIAGKRFFTGTPDNGLGQAMAETMTHRGPNAKGIFQNKDIVLSHCRLSIIDTTDAGTQPMSNEDGTIHIVYNGEIYNYQELRDRYLGGYSFKSETDTEVLLHLYEELGIDCLNELRGMFAFGIWDERHSRLVLARDRLGQKPLFYHQSDDAFLFGSTIKALLKDSNLTARPDHRAIQEYLTYQYVPHPRTGFDGIKKLGPGEYMIVDDDSITHNSYWSLPDSDPLTLSKKAIQQRLRKKVRDAVRLRLRSDVPLGVFLSGGIDSSITVAMMDDLGVDDIKTFSIGFDIAEFDETNYAQMVADRYNTDHHEFEVSPDEMASLPDIVDHYEMPFGDPSALPTYYVSKMASEHITVALAGDAGDENFAGYPRYANYKAISLASRLPNLTTNVGAKTVRSLPRQIREMIPRERDAERILRLAEKPKAERYAGLVGHFTENDIASVYDGPQKGDLLEWFRELFDTTPARKPVDEATGVDLRSYLPDDLLVKVDRASMAHSLEVRSPFLDHKLVEFARRIPAAQKMPRFEKKVVLKEAFRPYLPDAVVDRKKQGFGVPVGEWFRGHLKTRGREAIERLGEREAWDKAGLQRKWEAHVAGEKDDGRQLWDLVFLEEWYEQYID
ncbi:asparagine synthase (glutamine-hydrolyzing) [Halobellus marinus]|uniref:asparagine synthase (glutamine-hydrolyzing) n=1 Tax=Halobellus TaxID=1073986 RepID=UPI0028A789E0|nr:asparagine synthase (glutamine-hydrolyzing) [Halobellus sp. DFY28]